MSRLNGWQRIRILLSVLWAIGSWIWITRENLDRQTDLKYDPAVLLDQLCLEQPNADVGACNRRLWEDLADEAPLEIVQKTEDAHDAIFFALVPIPIGWLVAYALVGLVRWVKPGFRPT
jgi:hypothetical protein